MQELVIKKYWIFKDFRMQGATQLVKNAIVVLGPSAAGKSTFINLFARPGDQQAVGGAGSLSTTSVCRALVVDSHGLFPEPKMIIVDTIGFGDTRLTYTDEEIGLQIIEELFKKCKLTSFHILIFESYKNSRKINHTVRSLLKIFGP